MGFGWLQSWLVLYLGALCGDVCMHCVTYALACYWVQVQGAPSSRTHMR
jgi:hypothetical protein